MRLALSILAASCLPLMAIRYDIGRGDRSYVDLTNTYTVGGSMSATSLAAYIKLSNTNGGGGGGSGAWVPWADSSTNWLGSNGMAAAISAASNAVLNFSTNYTGLAVLGATNNLFKALTNFTDVAVLGATTEILRAAERVGSNLFVWRNGDSFSGVYARLDDLTVGVLPKPTLYGLNVGSCDAASYGMIVNSGYGAVNAGYIHDSCIGVNATGHGSENAGEFRRYSTVTASGAGSENAGYCDAFYLYSYMTASGIGSRNYGSVSVGSSVTASGVGSMNIGNSFLYGNVTAFGDGSFNAGVFSLGYNNPPVQVLANGAGSHNFGYFALPDRGYVTANGIGSGNEGRCDSSYVLAGGPASHNFIDAEMYADPYRNYYCPSYAMSCGTGSLNIGYLYGNFVSNYGNGSLCLVDSSDTKGYSINSNSASVLLGTGSTHYDRSVHAERLLAKKSVIVGDLWSKQCQDQSSYSNTLGLDYYVNTTDKSLYPIYSFAAPTYTNGIIGNGWFINYSVWPYIDCLRFPHIAAYNCLIYSHDFSANIWVKFKTLPQSADWYEDVIIGSDAGDPGFELAISTGYKIHVNEAYGDTISLSPEAWYMVSAVRDSVANTYYFYLNGASAGSYVGSGSLTTVPGNLIVPKQQDSAHQMTAAYDEFSLWNRVLSPSEVSALYASGSGRQIIANETGLVGAWNFECDPNSSNSTDSLVVNGNGVFTGMIRMQGSVTGATDVATKGYVDGCTNAIVIPPTDFTAMTNYVDFSIGVVSNYVINTSNNITISVLKTASNTFVKRTGDSLTGTYSFTDARMQTSICESAWFDYMTVTNMTLINVIATNTIQFTTNVNLLGVLNMNGYQITNVGDPVLPQSAVTKTRMDGATNLLQLNVNSASNAVLVYATNFTALTSNNLATASASLSNALSAVIVSSTNQCVQTNSCIAIPGTVGYLYSSDTSGTNLSFGTSYIDGATNACIQTNSVIGIVGAIGFFYSADVSGTNITFLGVDGVSNVRTTATENARWTNVDCRWHGVITGSYLIP